MSSLAASWFFAFLLGARHASEPDHLAAVTTLVANAPDARRAATLGACWGIGHSAALLALGGMLLVLRLQLPATLADLFELLVALMLLVLGARSILRAVRLGRAGHLAHHNHGHDAHTHPVSEAHLHVASLTLARRPLVLGLIQGLAGSGALVALALSNMPSLGSGLAFMVCFGCGSVIGMSALSGLIGAPLGRYARQRRVRVALIACAGVVSLVLGLLWAWPLVWRLAAA